VKLVLVLVVATAGCDLAFSLDRPVGVCPESFVAIGDAFYERVATTMTWRDAETTCESRVTPNRFSHLAVFADDAEFGEARAAYAGVPLWVGLTDLAAEGMFVPITDEVTTWPPLTTPPWSIGQPNNLDGIQNCVQIDPNGGLDDKPCMDTNGEKFEPLCECDANTPTFEQ
jgi:Lectin C-type domain